MRRKMLWAVCLAVCLLASMAVTAFAADTATLTIQPDKTEFVSDGGATKITYTITVSPPAGKEIGVFSFRLKPSGQMTLPADFTEDGQRVVTYADSGLAYDVTTGAGVFRTYEYTPASAFFAAVGTTPDNRMKSEAEIMTIVATVPAGVTGAFVLDADFTVAPDGSGNSYIPVVNSPAVVISAPAGSGSSGSSGGIPEGSGSAGGGTNIAVSELDRPVAGDKPDTQVNVAAPGRPQVTTTWTEDGAAMDGAASFRAGHVYTVTIRVKTNGAAFDTSVYTNAGYTVERVSDTELLIYRSFQVEDTYTRDLTEAEAETAAETARQEADTPEGDAAQPEDTAPAEQEAPADQGARSSGTVVVLAAAAAAAVAAVIVFSRRKRGSEKKADTKENSNTEGEGKQ